jgi:hypothetical protein
MARALYFVILAQYISGDNDQQLLTGTLKTQIPFAGTLTMFAFCFEEKNITYS